MQFDLVSDLNIENWQPKNQVNWSGLGTSLVAVVAGNVSKSLNQSYKAVLDISKNYSHVVYVDGINEHDNQPNINVTRNILKEKFSKYRNISYLYRTPVVLDQTVFIGCNGWSSFDFCEPIMSKQLCVKTLSHCGIEQDLVFEQWEMAIEDATYLGDNISKFTKDPAIKNIVIVTNTIPIREIKDLNPNISLIDLAMRSSSYLIDVLRRDQNNKIRYWVHGNATTKTFTRYHNVCFVSNPRGNSEYYYPELIKI
jgi:hypothetical protein